MIITIGGNIGSGKSTVIQEIQKLVQDVRKVFPEPIEKWGSWLDIFYTNPTKYAFPFQMKILYDFLYFDENTPPVVVTERSPIDSLYVFGKTLVDSKTMTYMEYNLFKDYVDSIGWKPNVYVYLKTSPTTCIERIKIRARNCETGIDEEYIKSIHQAYDNIVEYLPGDTIVHVVDANKNKTDVLESVKRILDQYGFFCNDNVYIP